MEEKKKLGQLRKEKEEERQLQELQRLQEEQTGKKRQEKLEWMYATPATGSGANANELEGYLLGKKRVDKILILVRIRVKHEGRGDLPVGER